MSPSSSPRRLPRKAVPQAPQAPAPAVRFTQAELRQRRRRRQPVIYGGGFDFAAEVAAICDPLAARVAANRNPTGYFAVVGDLAVAVHAVADGVISLLVERDARRKTAHLKSDRGRAMKMLVDLAERPPAPVIGCDDLVSGRWSAVLVGHVRPLTEPLAGYLATALPPDHESLRFQRSVSERVEVALRGIDRAALSVSRRLEMSAFYGGQRRPSGSNQAAPADQARAALSAMGVQV
jgi:hypothetical protein